MNFDNIPSELKQYGLFCTWKLDDRGKIPYNPVTKTLAKSNNKNTFHSYQQILPFLSEYYQIDESGKILGGLGLGIFNGYSAIDIDDCRDPKSGELSALANDVIQFCSSYTEISPSGKGIRIILKTPTLINKETHYINNRNNGLEIYISDNTNKYVTITGNVLYNNDIAEIDISYIVDRYMKKNTNQAATIQPTIDAEILEDVDIKLRNALRYNPRLKELWENKAPGSGSNESELDQSLCNSLAFVFEGNYPAIEQAFIKSPYFLSKDDKHVKKWYNHPTYREETIKGAITRFHNYKMQQVQEFELNDTGNAHRFVDNFNHLVRFNVDNKQWMVYNGHYWQNDTYNHVKNLAEIVIEQMKQDALAAYGEQRKELFKNVKRVLSSSGKESMIREAQHLKSIPVTNADFDTEDYLFSTKSGVVDLRNGTILEANKEQMLSRHSDVEIDKGEPKLWLKFLSEIFNNRTDIIEYIQRILGYAMTGYTKEQSMFIFLGDGSNGKSLLLEVVSKILGSYGTTSSVDILVERRNHSANMSEIARLNNIRTVITDETEMGDRLKESGIKSMTSDHGYITARFLYGNEFTFKPKFKIFMATNHRPIIRGTDHGIWRRIKIIPFDVIIPDDKQDRYLGEKLYNERGKILWWMIEGSMKWFKDGLKTPNLISAAITDYRSEMDLVQRWINENCEIDSTATTPSIELFKNITQYIYDNKEFQMSNTLFGRNMSKKFKKRRIGNTTHYIGIRLRTKTIVEALDEVEGDSDI